MSCNPIDQIIKTLHLMVHFIKWVLKLGVSEIKKISKKNNLSQKVAKHQIPQMGPEAVFFRNQKDLKEKPKSS